MLTNALLSGVVPEFEARLGVPVFVTLQGDDIFLDALPASRSPAVRRTDPRELRERRRLHLHEPLLRRLHGRLPRLAAGEDARRLPRDQPRRPRRPADGANRAAADDRLLRPHLPEKGFHHLVEAFIRAAADARRAACEDCRRAAGSARTTARSSTSRSRNSRPPGSPTTSSTSSAPTHADKVRFLQSIDVLSVPTTYREPKGLYVLEAWANGVPVVQPRHGSFPELIEATGGGLLVEPDDPDRARRRSQADARRPRAARPGRPRGRGRGPGAVHRRGDGRGVVSVLEPATPALYTPDMTPFTTTRRVEFGDTDMAGIMHFANFFRFMESAETISCTRSGCPCRWREDGVKWGFPRVSAACDFQKPGRVRGRADDRGDGREGRGEVGELPLRLHQPARRAARGRADHGGVLPPPRAGTSWSRSRFPPNIRAKLEA